MTTTKHPEDVLWYALPAEDVGERIGVDPAQGLDVGEARRRLAQYGPNSCRPSRRRACGRSPRVSCRTR